MANIPEAWVDRIAVRSPWYGPSATRDICEAFVNELDVELSKSEDRMTAECGRPPGEITGLYESGFRQGIRAVRQLLQVGPHA